MVREIQSVPDKAGEPYHLLKIKQIHRRSDFSYSDAAESSCRFQWYGAGLSLIDCSGNVSVGTF